MSSWVTVILGALILGLAFSGSSFFVTRQQDVLFQCYYDSTLSTNKTFNTYKTTNNGFPFAFYAKNSQPVSSGCQKPEYPDKNLAFSADGNIVESGSLNKQEFAKDFVVWSAVFLTVGIFAFGVKKKS
jgi:ABC-type transport system involved in multi-copper enzyme maturation permease subunit